MKRRTVHRVCTLCEATCGLAIEVQDRRVLAIRGDAADPFSRGHMCAKAPALADLHEDPDRLRRPVKRTESGFVEISWADAFESAAEGLLAARKRGGADAIALYRGNPSRPRSRQHPLLHRPAAGGGDAEPLLGRPPQCTHGKPRPAGRGHVCPGGRSVRLRVRPGRRGNPFRASTRAAWAATTRSSASSPWLPSPRKSRPMATVNSSKRLEVAERPLGPRDAAAQSAAELRLALQTAIYSRAILSFVSTASSTILLTRSGMLGTS